MGSNIDSSLKHTVILFLQISEKTRKNTQDGLKPISYAKEKITVINFGRPRIDDLNWSEKRFPSIANSVTRIIGFGKPLPKTKQVIIYIRKIRSEQKMMILGKFKVQPAVSFYETVAGNTQKIISIKGNKVVDQIRTIAA